MYKSTSVDPVNDLARRWHTDTLETEVILEGIFYDRILRQA